MAGHSRVEFRRPCSFSVQCCSCGRGLGDRAEHVFSKTKRRWTRKRESLPHAEVLPLPDGLDFGSLETVLALSDSTAPQLFPKSLVPLVEDMDVAHAQDCVQPACDRVGKVTVAEQIPSLAKTRRWIRNHDSSKHVDAVSETDASISAGNALRGMHHGARLYQHVRAKHFRLTSSCGASASLCSKSTSCLRDAVGVPNWQRLPRPQVYRKHCRAGSVRVSHVESDRGFDPLSLHDGSTKSLLDFVRGVLVRIDARQDTLACTGEGVCVHLCLLRTLCRVTRV